MFEKYFKTKGFSLIEVIVALGVLSVGLLGVSSLIIQSLQAQNVNQNYLIASMLAQEGAELIRNKRDYNWIKNLWSEWKVSDVIDSDYDIVQTAGGGVFSIDYDGTIDATVVDHTSAGAQLAINAAGFYSHTGVEGTPFSRLFRVTDFNGIPDDSIAIKVEVRWVEKGITHNYVVDMGLYNWR